MLKNVILWQITTSTACNSNNTTLNESLVVPELKAPTDKPCLNSVLNRVPYRYIRDLTVLPIRIKCFLYKVLLPPMCGRAAIFLYYSCSMLYFIILPDSHHHCIIRDVTLLSTEPAPIVAIFHFYALYDSCSYPYVRSFPTVNASSQSCIGRNMNKVTTLQSCSITAVLMMQCCPNNYTAFNTTQP
jgi:hypothetical protein